MRKKQMAKISFIFILLLFASGLAVSADKVDINTATAAQLQTLDRIGPVIAQRIVEYRSTVQLFQKPEDLKNVKGVGDKIFEKNKDRITVTIPKATTPSEKQKPDTSKKGS